MSIVNILIVDDENFVCENLKLKLKRLKHDIAYITTTCNTAKEALILTDQTSFDIIFTDIRMPFMDGISFIKALRDKHFTNKIFVLSGYDDFGYVRTAFLNGADDYLLKPIAISQLEEKLSFCQHPNNILQDSSSLITPQNIIDYAKEYIEHNYQNSALDMSEVASHIALSYSHFSHLFNKETGISFPSYLADVRIKKAIVLLSDPSMKVSEICYKVGFKSPQQFSRCFKNITGIYPSQYHST